MLCIYDLYQIVKKIVRKSNITVFLIFFLYPNLPASALFTLYSELVQALPVLGECECWSDLRWPALIIIVENAKPSQ